MPLTLKDLICSTSVNPIYPHLELYTNCKRHEANTMTQETIKVEGMSCEHCQMAVNKAISGIVGVSNVEVNLKDGQATVDFDEDKTNTDAIKAAVVEAGYKA